MRVVAAAAVAVAFSFPAAAADLYAPPPISDPIYAPAPMAVVGHLDLGIGFNKWRNDSEGHGFFEAAGRANILFHNGWNLQVETGGGANFFNNGYSFATVGAAAHVWNRGQAGALGVFGGADFGSGFGINTGFVGVEGELDVGQNAVLGAQAAYGFGTGGYDYWNARGWGSYYFTPDTKLRGEVGYTSYNGDTRVWDLSAELEHRFTATPVSAFGKLGYTDFDAGIYGKETAWRGVIGARVFMDQPGTTLRDHDRQVPWDLRPVASSFFQRPF